MSCIIELQEEMREPPMDMPEVVNDFDIEDEEVAIENRCSIIKHLHYTFSAQNFSKQL